MRKVKTKVSGSITVESAIIIPLVFLIVVEIIKFSFLIHDAAVSGILCEYFLMKENNAVSMYYNVDSKKIDIKEIVNTPTYNVSSNNREQKKNKLRRSFEEYLEYMMWGKDDSVIRKYTDNQLVIKNATIIRGTDILIKHGERLLND